MIGDDLRGFGLRCGARFGDRCIGPPRAAARFSSACTRRDFRSYSNCAMSAPTLSMYARRDAIAEPTGLRKIALKDDQED